MRRDVHVNRTVPGVPEFVAVTIFPAMFPGPLAFGVVGRGLERGLIRLTVRDLREFADPPHRQVDDTPFGGGPGMVLRPEPLFHAVEAIRSERPGRTPRVVLLDPGGRRLTQKVARDFADSECLVLLCGRYEGVDERVRTHLVDDEISIGDYIVAGGELPAMVLIESVARLVPGVVGQSESVARESFEESTLDHPFFTRPADFRGLTVPEVLLSGHHAAIENWRRQAAQERTKGRRPDLLSSSRPPARREAARHDSHE